MLSEEATNTWKLFPLSTMDTKILMKKKGLNTVELNKEVQMKPAKKLKSLSWEKKLQTFENYLTLSTKE
jgi:hypothetical protein